MELHYLPTETPTTASSCSTDPLYDNCPPFAQRGREREMESRVVCAAVTRLPGPCSPLPALAPAEVLTLVSGGRGTGSWPDHSYCSWRGGLGRQGWEAVADTALNRSRGGEQGGRWGADDKARLKHSPSPSQSEEHRSALSLYDNLPDAVTPDSLREVLDMETSFQEDSQEQMYRAWAPEHAQRLMDEEGLSEDKSTWSSCEIILSESGYKQEPELDSGTCGLKMEAPMVLPKAPTSSPQHLPAMSKTESQVTWPLARVQHQEEPSRTPRVPPPVPLADPSASALRSLLTSLQQQVVKQRDEYEARIVR